MANIKTIIDMQDNMSSKLKRITEGMNSLVARMQAVDSATNRGFDVSELESYQNELNDINNLFKDLNKEIGKLGNGKISTGALALGNVVGNLITSAANAGIQGIRHMINEFESDIRMETQLAASLANTSTDPSKAFENIKNKASEVSANGMFSAGSMVGAGAEFATYFSDSKAIEMMMDTLTDYASGMSGGKAVGSEEMVNYATNLGKIMTGSYQAMNMKGFEFSETQKRIIEGTASQAEKTALQAEMMSQGYENVTEEMMQAYAISQSITESWGGMYDAMSQTPTGKMTQMFNQINDLASTVGGRILYYVGEIANTINNNMGAIEAIFNGLGVGVAVVLSIFNDLLNLLLQNLPVVTSVLAVFTAGVIANTVANIANTASIFAATVAQNGLNAALALCPITWIVMGIAAIIAAVVLFANHIAKTTDGVGSAVGVIVGWLNVAKTAVFNVFDTIVTFISNRIADIKVFFYGLLGTVTSIILAIVEKLNTLPFINIDTSSLQDKAMDYANKMAEAENSKRDPLKSWEGDWVGKAFQEGAAIGDGIANKFGEMFNFGTENPMLAKLAGIEQNTGDTVSALTESNNEELAYMRDLAEAETVNRFTTAEVKIDMGGISQTVNNETDADALVDYLVKAIQSGINSDAVGVYG